MADPFSIVAGTTGVIDIAFRFAQFVKNTATATAQLDDDLKAILEETEHVISVNRSIHELLSTEYFQTPTPKTAGGDALKDLWSDTERILNDCRLVLDKLLKLAKEIVGKKHERFEVGKHRSIGEWTGDFRRQLRKQKKDGEFSRLRLQLSTSQGALQTSFTMMNLWHSHKSQNTAAASLNRLLEQFGSLAIDLKAQLSSLQPADPPPYVTNKHFHAPAVNVFFTGRKALLERLSVSFMINGEGGKQIIDPMPQAQKRFVIYGLGGSGKTEFCCKYAEINQRHFWGVFWVDASSDENAQHSFRTIANVGGVDPNIKSATSWLSSLTYPWLLVLDNADNPDIPIDRYLPGGERGHILVTTRNPSLKKYGTIGGGSCQFERLEDEDAERLLLKAAEEPTPWKETAMKLAASIAKSLGHLPLAVLHAGRAIAVRLATLANYIDYFEDHWQGLRYRWQNSGYVFDDSRRNVFGSYDMIYQHLNKQPSEGARDAIEVLKLFSFFHHENILFDFLTQAAKNPWRKEKVEVEEHSKIEHDNVIDPDVVKAKPYAQRIREWVVELMSEYIDPGCATLPSVLRDSDSLGSFSVHRLRQALAELEQRSLITHRRANALDVYSMHPLVHKWVREGPHMRIAERGVWCQSAITTLTQCIAFPPLRSASAERETRRHLLPHLDHVRGCQTQIQFQIESQRKKTKRPSWLLLGTPRMDRNKVIQLAKFSRVYAECGRFDVAADLLLQVKNFLLDRLGTEDPRTLQTILALANIYWILTRYGEAVELQEQALQSYTNSLGRYHHKTLQLLDVLGKSNSFRGRFKESLELHEDALEGMRKTLPPDHPDIFRATNHMGVAHQRYFRFETAKDLHSEALVGLTRVLDSTHEDTIEAKDNLAMAHLELGGDNIFHARKLMIEVVEHRSKSLGREHPLTLWSKCNLARIKSALGQTREAEQDIRAGLPIATRIFGENHLGVLMGWTHLAQVLVRQKRYLDAEEIFSNVIERSKYKFGAREEGEHPDHIMATWYAAECYKLQGKYKQALQLCDEISKSLSSIGGRQHPFAMRLANKQDELRQLARSTKPSALTMTAFNKSSGTTIEGKEPELALDRRHSF
ncbi:MAG: hypothetical protein LQ342_001714 [Letrouitia transgressa]|nr:MAG: hypothetical protein LQ342_001714 [Letrouitia transgressa]